MKALEEIRKTHEDVRNVEVSINDGLMKWTVETKYEATRLPEDEDWRSERALKIPHSMLDILSPYTVSYRRANWFDKGRVRGDVLNRVLACQIIDVMHSATSFSEDDENKVIFEDILVLQPTNRKLSGIRIYVNQGEAGHFQPRDIDKMVGQVVPVLIATLYQVQFGERYDRLKSYSEENNEQLDISKTYDEYIALGTIDGAEYLTGRYVLDDWNDVQEENVTPDSPILDVQEGRITYITENGFFVLSRAKERVFIQNKDFSYKYLSKAYNSRKGDFSSIARIGDTVQYKILKAQEVQNTDDARKRGISGNSIVILGERLSLETPPMDIIKSIIKGGTGTTISGHIIEWDSVKGHRFEPEGGYGYTFILNRSNQLSKTVYNKRQKVSVRIGKNPTYEVRENKNGQKYLKLRVTCYYNSSFDDASGFDDFFD